MVSELKFANGVAAISTILLVGGIIVEVAAAGLLASYLVFQQGLGMKASYSAFLSAQSGLNDALLKLSRYGDSVTNQTYYLSSNGNITKVDISKETLLNNDSKYTITSTAEVLKKRRIIQAIVIIDYITGRSQIDQIGEVTL